MGVKKIRFPETSGIGIKPVSREGTERLVRAAIEYALEHSRKSVTLVHKGNIMKFTEGAFENWGYELAEREFGDKVFTWVSGTDQGEGQDAANAHRPRRKAGKIIVKDAIADITLQQILTRPDEFDVDRHPEPERRLPLRRAGGPGGRHRHRAGRQHQLRDRPRHVRGDPRHRPQVRRTRTR